MITTMQGRKLNKSKQWYLSRDTGTTNVRCHDATKTGVIKKHGCCRYVPTNWRVDYTFLAPTECKAYFGHYPAGSSLIYVEKKNGKWSKEIIDLAFS